MENQDGRVALFRGNPEAQFLPGALFMKSGPEDYIGAALAVRGTLYFNGSHTPEVRSAICACFEAYEEIAKEHLAWLWRDEPPSGPSKYAYAKAPAMRKMMDKMQPNDLASFAYSSGVKPEDAGQWMFYVSGVRAWQVKAGHYGLGTLTFSFPPLFVEENPTIFQKLFVDFARTLKAVHGFGGLAFNLSLVRTEANEPTEAYLAEKLNGIDAGDPVLMGTRKKYDIKDHIKTIGWLTAINYEMAEKVGGLARLRSELPMNWFAKYDYGNGIVIQAGPKPEMAIVAEDPRPAIYVLPNIALKDIRLATIGSLHYPSTDGEPRLAGWSADQWLKRFDIEDDDLLAYKNKLLGEPKLTKEATLPDQL